MTRKNVTRGILRDSLNLCRDAGRKGLRGCRENDLMNGPEIGRVDTVRFATGNNQKRKGRCNE